ncbi:MAG: hypothetical protein V3T77_01745 [Planctomycetota bacterium]
MSPLAKVFVVLNLILALSFLAVSATLFQASDNWKRVAERENEVRLSEIDAFKSVKERLDGQVSSLEATKAQLSGENSTLSQEKNRLLDANGDLRKEKARLEGKIDSLETHLATRADQISDLNEDIKRLSSLKDRLQKESNDAVEEKKASVLVMNRSLLHTNQLAADLEEMRIQLSVMRKDYEESDSILQRIVGSGFDLTQFIIPMPAPPIDGTVVAVKQDVDLVILSVGDDDKVKPGFEFTVYRDGQFVAKVQVSRVTADMSGARILFQEPGQSILPGDKATTRLN